MRRLEDEQIDGFRRDTKKWQRRTYNIVAISVGAILGALLLIFGKGAGKWLALVPIPLGLVLRTVILRWIDPSH